MGRCCQPSSKMKRHDSVLKSQRRRLSVIVDGEFNFLMFYFVSIHHLNPCHLVNVFLKRYSHAKGYFSTERKRNSIRESKGFPFFCSAANIGISILSREYHEGHPFLFPFAILTIRVNSSTSSKDSLILLSTFAWARSRFRAFTSEKLLSKNCS